MTDSEERPPILVSAAIGGNTSLEIEAWVVDIETPAGKFMIGVDNNGQTYLASANKGMPRLVLIPQSANRVLIESGHDGC